MGHFYMTKAAPHGATSAHKQTRIRVSLGCLSMGYKDTPVFYFNLYSCIYPASSKKICIFATAAQSQLSLSLP